MIWGLDKRSLCDDRTRLLHITRQIALCIIVDRYQIVWYLAAERFIQIDLLIPMLRFSIQCIYKLGKIPSEYLVGRIKTQGGTVEFELDQS